jgi:hypothetical protein
MVKYQSAHAVHRCCWRLTGTVSLIALEPSGRLSAWVIGDFSRDSDGGVVGGETDDGEDIKEMLMAMCRESLKIGSGLMV